MTEVKFIQIGANQDLIWDSSLTPAAGSYNAVRNDALQSYPSAIIFGQYKKSVGATKVYYELWANGKEYKIGGSGDIIVFSSSDDPWTYFTPGHGGAAETPVQGTYYIKTVGQARTAYILTSENYQLEASWAALSGNVNAENVFFPNGFERTEQWGTAGASVLPVTDQDIVGKNLKEVFEYYLVKEAWPSVDTTTDNSTSPTFTAEDGGTTLVVKYTNASGAAISDGENVLYNSVIYIKNTYDPTLTVTAIPGESSLDGFDPTSTKTLTFGPNKIINMYEKGWSNVVTGGTITTGSTRSGDQVSAVRQSVTTTNNQTNTSVIKIESDTVATANAESGNDVEVTHTTGAQTSLGSKTISVENTNANSITTTYKVGETTVTSVSIPAIGNTYYLSNKGNRQSDKKINKDAVTVNLPTAATKTISTDSLTYKVYLPVYLYKNSVTPTEIKYYGSLITLYDNVEIGIALPGDRDNWKVEFPASSSINTLTINGVTMTNNVHYTITTTSKTVGEATVSYKILKFTDSAACTTDAKIVLKIN